MATTPVTLDFSKATPIQPVTLDFSKAVPISGAASSDKGVLDAQGGPMDLLRGAGAGIRDMVAHPIDTLKGMVQPLMDAMPSYASGPMGIPIPVPNVQGLQNASQQVQAVQEHPYYQAGRVIGPALLTHGLTKIAPMIAPAAIDAAGGAALLGKTPEAAYESAMKPSPSIPAPQRAAMVQTGLANEVPVSKAGIEKIGDLINDLNSKIASTIATDPNRPINPNAVATRADLAKAKFANQVNASGDLAAIEASKNQFLQEQGANQSPSIGPPSPAPDMGAADAQAMKQGTYRVLAGKYGEQGSASTEAQKALARGLKEEIATQFPEIGNLNAAESKLLDLQPVLERAVNRISNHQAIGIGTPIAGTAVKAVSGSTSAGAVAMTLKAVLDNPNVKSRLAIAVSKAQKIPFSQASAQVQAYSSTLGAYAGATQANSAADNSAPAANQ